MGRLDNSLQISWKCKYKSGEESLRVINRDLNSSIGINIRMEKFKLHIRECFLVVY